MFGLDDLKPNLKVTDSHVECPVEGCRKKVSRRRREQPLRSDGFRCTTHEIFISPSTFEYQDDVNNMLDQSHIEQQLFRRILANKRESRFARDNSEDAVTWNVFRYLERHNLLLDLCHQQDGVSSRIEDVIYWSFSRIQGGCWKHLNEARIEFGESTDKGSEPDVIVVTDKSLFFVEAKLTATNNTTPSKQSSRKKYESGGARHFSTVFQPDFDQIAVKHKKYELMRLWLLGTWLAQELGLKFYLVNLVCDAKEKQIEDQFGPMIVTGPNRQFVRWTWERIYRHIARQPPANESRAILTYYKNKTVGYGGAPNRRIRPAFTI